MSNIPKIVHFFWSGQNLSYLQYLTVISFHKFNPDWEIIIHECDEPQTDISWDTDEQKLEYIGKDYLPNLKQLEYVKFNRVNFNDIGFSEDVSDVYKSDYIRWYLLSTIGGVWSDIDILYIKPLSELKIPNNVNTVFCRGEWKHVIGFLMSAPNNDFFKFIRDKANFHFDPYEYQSIGAKLLNYYDDKLNNEVSLNLDYDAFYSYNHMNIEKIFGSDDLSLINDKTIGIHWFNGSDIAKEFTNIFTEEAEIDNVITNVISKYKILD